MAEGGLQVQVLGVGVVGPGLDHWPQTRRVLRGERPYARVATVLPPPSLLPATERRRAGAIIKVSILAAEEALGAAGLAATDVATVFSASEGDGRNCHDLCETLASANRLVSPTRFTNSVHNAPAGYWHIATHSMAASTSLCAHDASFAEGLMEAALQAVHGDTAVLLVVADAPYPEPLQATRPLPDTMAIALLLATRDPDRRSLGTLQLNPAPAADAQACADAGLRALTNALPTARGLPLLEALAREAPCDCTIACHPGRVVTARFRPAHA